MYNRKRSRNGIWFKNGMSYIGRNKKSNLALLTWAQKAKLEARNIETSLVNLKMLKESLPEIRSMTTMGGSILLQAKPS